MQTKTYGMRGEILATNYLKKQGYTIVANNYKNQIGEIDIICKDKGTLVFVEVKTRMSQAFGNPLEAIDERKQYKIRQVATMYLKQHGLFEKQPIRFDAVAVLGSGDDDITHIPNAF